MLFLNTLIKALIKEIYIFYNYPRKTMCKFVIIVRKRGLKMKKAIICLLFLLSGCSGFSYSSRSDAEYFGSPTGGDLGHVDEPVVPRPQIQAGQLTAAHWNDQKNFGFWRSLFSSDQENQAGIFSAYRAGMPFGYFDTLNLIEVRLNFGSEAVSGAKVLLFSGDECAYRAVSNRQGIAYLYPCTDQLDSLSLIKIELANVAYEFSYAYPKEPVEADVVTYELPEAPALAASIELMFVVDTTGSMSDELEYLIAEIADVIDEVSKTNPETQISLALLFYRDIGDLYITRYFDFTTDIIAQQVNLAAQSAVGGGDYEEAVERALDEAVNKQWSTGNTTKLLIHVLDAPPHYQNGKIMETYEQSVLLASQKGIRMIPVASSGIDKRTEYFLRCQAMMTGGDYIFLTDDSGIGGGHLQATVGEVVVEYLNKLLIRIINEHHTGIPSLPVPYSETN